MTAQRFRRYRDDPFAYADEAARIHLYSAQRRLVVALQEHDKVACKAANAVGKTRAAAFAIEHHLAGGPGSVVVATSATVAQLKRVLMREVRGGFKRAGDFFAGALVGENENRLGDDWYLAAFSTDVPEAMQGVQAERVLVVVDEASGVSEDNFDAIEGVLAGGDAKLLLIGNPLRTSGTFYDAFHSRRDGFETLTISAYDTPAFTGEEVPREVQKRLVSRRWVERLEKRSAGSNTFVTITEYVQARDGWLVRAVDVAAQEARERLHAERRARHAATQRLSVKPYEGGRGRRIIFAESDP